MGTSALADPNGTTALHEAAYRDDTEAALRLIGEGADPGAANRYGVTPLSLACQNGNETLVGALLAAGAGCNDALKGKETPLMTAARTGRLGPVRLLVEHGAEVEATERKGQTALMWAAAEGHAEVVKFLLEAGAEANRRLDSGFTPLLFAVREGKAEAAAGLLDAGVDVNEATPEGTGGRSLPHGASPLSVAVENGHFDLAVMLLERGADPDDQRSGMAPLHILTGVRKPNRGDGPDGLPPPDGSGSMTSLGFARALVERFGADPDMILEKGNAGGPRFGMRGATPFLLAAHTKDLDYLKLLLELGADPGLANSDGTTPLMAAAGVGALAPEEEAGTEDEALAVIGWLIEHGATVNGVNRNGETAMHGAAYKNFPKVAAYLAEHGASVEEWDRENKHGWTPLLIARGFRPGNFKPSAATIASLETILKEAGVEIPPHPPLPSTEKKQGY